VLTHAPRPLPSNAHLGHYARHRHPLRRWKTLVPFLYDWFAHHRLVWPSLSVRWGAVLAGAYTRSLQSST